jgi:6-pyruvoyltetrahydropterin/6-carboxytetrahydropterin synthase
MKLGLTEHIDCAHFLEGHPKCGRMHGHTYRVDLVIEGETRNGMVVDFGDLREMVRRVLGPFDHILWNDFLKYPSVENISELLREKLEETLPFPFVLRVFEGQGKWAEVSSRKAL